MRKKVMVALIMSLSGLALYGDSLPDWFLPLREAVYEQRIDAGEIAALYIDAKTRAERDYSGYTLNIMLSRIEYMMGRAYQAEERKAEAAERYEAGIYYAEAALKLQDTTEGWQMLAENISQSCAVRPASWAMANGLKVEKYAKTALEKKPGNTAALYMLAARWVYAPAPFHNYKRGIQMMQDIITGFEADMPKDDLFNVYSAIGYAYVQQKKYDEAKPWLLKSLAVYPSNKYVRSLLEKT
jgi:tetratricopeptide (TPR) repeat protein